MNRFLTFIAAIVLLASCRSTRPIQTVMQKKSDTIETVTVSNAKKDSLLYIQSVLAGIQANRIDFKTFSAKINVDYRGGDNKHYDVNANVRMYKDSAIWISVNALLGIEAMRALITKDSVFLLDKLNKTYTARSVDYLQEVTALPLNLSTLQDLIIGNAVFLDSNVVNYSKNQGNNTISLMSIGQWFKNLLSVNESDKTLVNSKLDDVAVGRSRTANLSYSDYETKKGPRFSTKRRITVSEKNQLDIALEYKQYDLNGEVSFPFSVPKNFKRN